MSYKENGRLGPSKKEKSNKKGLVLMCPNCGKRYVVDDPEFGADYLCDTCDVSLIMKKRK